MIRNNVRRRPALARPRPAAGGRSSWTGKSGGTSSPRTILLVLALLALIALVAALGVAWGVRSGELEMERQQHNNQELVQQNRMLSEQRDQLLSRERIEKEAAKLGLFPPTADQIREL